MFELVNETAASAALVPGWTLEGDYQQVIVAKMTLQFDLDGNLSMIDQEPVVLADEHHGDPQETSLKKASEAAAFKQGAEYYLQGHACSPGGKQTSRHVSVTLTQGGLTRSKQLAVLGEHHWIKGLLGYRRSDPQSFSRMPLRYELAFGGTQARTGRREKRNPVGRGFNPSGWSLQDSRAPQIEYLGQAQLSPAKQTPVASFAPLPASWAPRHSRFGELSSQPLDGQGCPWGKGAHPALHHCAPEDQWLAEPFTGGETVELQGFFADRESPVSLTLPVWTPQVLLVRRGHRPQRHTLRCDTLQIDTDKQTLSLVARTSLCPSVTLGQPAWLMLQAITASGVPA